MKLEHIILFGITFALCGNTFAYSPYANTITNNLSKKSFLTAASFPTTAADATFVERVENKRAGYEPYFDRSAFAGMSIEEQDELELMAYRAEVLRQQQLRNTSKITYCQTHPHDSVCGNTNLPITESTPQNTRYTDTIYMRAALTPTNIYKYNLATHNGGCTPPEYSDWWPNKIYTSGQYAQNAPAFEKFMITAFRKEGDCGTLPNDPGGYTCYGCASKNNGLCSGVDMNTVTREKVEKLAYDKIYVHDGIYKLPDAFRGYALWGIWGSGPITGINIFQRALNVPETGKIDEATIHAAETYTGDFADAYVREQEKLYRLLVEKNPKHKDHIDGWLNSLKLLRPSGCHVVPTNPITR